MRYLFSPSGGLVYHLIARRRARSLWAPFRASVRAWLTQWFSNLSQDELIVFGPSGGYTLPLDLISRFKRVTFVEPDPLARLLLRRRMPLAEFVSRADLLPWTGEGFSEFLSANPQAAVLFSNVLGQVALHSKRDGRDEFLKALRGRAWASYHDLYSGPARNGAGASRDPSQVFASGDVIDHETQWLAEGRATETALWPLTGTSTHIIDFVYSS